MTGKSLDMEGFGRTNHIQNQDKSVNDLELQFRVTYIQANLFCYEPLHIFIEETKYTVKQPWSESRECNLWTNQNESKFFPYDQDTATWSEI